MRFVGVVMLMWGKREFDRMRYNINLLVKIIGRGVMLTRHMGIHRGVMLTCEGVCQKCNINVATRDQVIRGVMLTCSLDHRQRCHVNVPYGVLTEA